MAVTVAAVMRRVRNYFEKGYCRGRFDIVDGRLSPAPAAAWVAIQGSRYHDGVYQLVGGRLTNLTRPMPQERFEGTVWLLSPPEDFLSLCRDVSEYHDKRPADAFQSERFGDYSYTRAANKDWAEAFARELLPYRRMTSEVDV